MDLLTNPKNRNRRTYGFLYPLCLLCFPLWFAHCQPSQAKNIDPATLRFHLSTDPITLNPVLAEDAYSSAVAGRIYESLIDRDPKTLQWRGLLAESYEIAPDMLTYTFHLRHGVTFHDGEPFTASDVLYTYHKIMDKSTPNPQMKVYFNDVKSISAPDDYTIVFKMKRPYFLSLEHLGSFAIIPEHIFSKTENFVNNEHNMREPVGTGPYRLEKWITRQKVTLVRYENYWGLKPEITRLEYKIVEENAVAFQSLKKGNIDVFNMSPMQWLRQSDSEKFRASFEKHKYLSMGYRYIGYNTRQFPFDDKRVRVAMTYLINREKIKQAILKDQAVITTGNFWIGSNQYNHDLEPRPYNPEIAAALLKEAGFRDTDGDGYLDKNNRKLSFELMIPSGAEFSTRFAAIVKEDLESAGVEAIINPVQFQVLIEKINERNFESVMLGWSMGIEGDPYQLWHSSQLEKGHNFTGFSTPEMDKIIEDARKELDEEKRNRMYRRFHEILYENQPYTFLYTSYNLVAVHRRFENVEIYKTGLDIMEWTMNRNFLTP